MKKILAIGLSLVMAASVFAGCGNKKSTNTSVGNITDVEFKFNEEALKVSDSSELPDWTGKQLELLMWYGSGSYSPKKNNVSENDVVTPELARVTGVKFSKESFDNNGDTMDAKIAKILATDKLPDVIWGSQENITNQLIEQDMLWELSELIPKYMPNLHKYMEQGQFMKSKRADGKIYEVTLGVPITYAYPDMDPNILARTSVPKANTGYVLVRDDILKKLKPEAYTQDELIAKFNENGKFTEEEILNASFNSKEEFFQFLRDVKALGMKSENRDVFATYAFTGSDNWDLMSYLIGGLYGYNCFPNGSGNDYYTYFDVETGKIEIMYEQEWFKEAVKEIVELIQEDVISEDSIIDNKASFDEKCATGQYAVLYGGTIPNVNTLNENAKGYKYRKVTLNIPFDETKYIPLVDMFGSGRGYAFVKPNISEDEIAQVLRYFDFMLTDVAQKLTMWGPKSAGLFEETENGRRFTNKELEDCVIYGVSNDAQLKYGLANKQWPGYPEHVNRWDPRFIYDFVPSVTQLNNFYSTGVYDPLQDIHGIAPRIYGNIQTFVPDVERFWNARTAFETGLTKVLTAKNDAEFDALWNSMLNIGRRNGMTEETLKQINDVWVNNVNKDNMDNVENYLKENKK